MRDDRRTFLHRVAALAAAWPLGAAAQGGYPRQPVKLVVPFTPGSATDVVARAVGERLEKAFAQTVVVENRPGAGGTLGAAAVAQAVPDGCTLLVHSAGHVANAALFPALRYDTQKDFAPVTMLATLPNVLVVAPSKGFRSVQDLVQKARAEPDKLLYGSAGNGSATHINAEKFRLSTGLRATHVPYRGTPEALTDVMGGRIDWFFAPLVSALPLIKDGRLQALAVGSPTRAALLPDVPTTLEAGYKGSDYLFWVGLFAPSRTPEDALARLHQETLKALANDEVRTRLERLGAQVAGMPRAEFAALVNTEIAATAVLIRQAGIRLDG